MLRILIIASFCLLLTACDSGNQGEDYEVEFVTPAENEVIQANIPFVIKLQISGAPDFEEVVFAISSTTIPRDSAPQQYRRAFTDPLPIYEGENPGEYFVETSYTQFLVPGNSLSSNFTLHAESSTEQRNTLASLDIVIK